jgi:hypothetical protein
MSFGSLRTVMCTCLMAAILAAIGTNARQTRPGAAVRQLAYLTASNAEPGDHFACGGSLPGHIGNAMAVSGDGTTVAIGAPHESSAARGINGNQDDNSLYNSGAVYVYVRRGNAWTQQAYIKASNAGGSDMFGLSLAISRDGSTLAIAAPWEASAATGVNGNQNDDSIPQAGAVYIFTRTGGTWVQDAYIKASNTGRKGLGDDVEGDQFGFSLAISGDGQTLAVGAVSEDSRATGLNGAENNDLAASSGAVYMFGRTGNAWAQHAYLKSSNNEAGDLFGYVVALDDDGNALAVAGFDEDGSGKGVNPADDNRANGTGAIYAFDRRGGVWHQSGYFKGSRSQRNDALGYSVAISGDGNTIAAGTGDESCLNGGINPSGCDVDTFPSNMEAGSAGAAYVWVRNGDTWREQAFIKASNPDFGDWFAARLALSADGNRLVVAAAMEDSDANGVGGDQDDDSAEDAGAAYIYARTGTTWRQQAYIKASNTASYDEFGSSIAISADGRTIAAGARMKNEGSGAAYISQITN